MRSAIELAQVMSLVQYLDLRAFGYLSPLQNAWFGEQPIQAWLVL